MAKKRVGGLGAGLVDRTLLITLVLMATGYIVRDSWVGVFAATGAFVLGILWSVRAIQTNPSRIFRLMAALVLVLASLLLSMFMARAMGVA